MEVTRISPRTGISTTLDLPVTPAQLAEFALPVGQRRYVHEIFPECNASQREFLMTGYTDADWDAMFPEEEEDEEEGEDAE